MNLPIIRKDGNYYIFKPSPEAVKIKAQPQPFKQAASKEEVYSKALAQAQRAGFHNPDVNTVRSFFEVQVGVYQGQTFRWLVENDMGWVTWLLTRIEQEGGNLGASNINDNKRALKWYVESFPEGRAALAQRRRENIQKQSLVSSNLPAKKVAKRLQQETRQVKPNIPSTSAPKKAKIDNISEIVSTKDEFDGDDAGINLAYDEIVPQSRPKESAVPIKPASSMMEMAQPDQYPLPKGWKASLLEVDKKWISKAICRYNSHGVLEVQPTQLWYYPPQPDLIPSQLPSVNRYFAHSLFVWMPKKLWRVRLHCVKPDCENELVRAGNYPIVRHVLNITEYYLMVTEKLECRGCKSKYISWSGAIVNQLDISRRNQFPVILTYRYACDESVITLLRTRGLGNSAFQLQRKLQEQHHKKWLSRVALYLADCKGFTSSDLLVPCAVTKPPSQLPVPKYKWFQMVYCLDVMNRLDEVKAAITSTFGRILKMDSTKKVAKKLAGEGRGTATWATNVGNEDGQVLISVLTCQEGYLGLSPMVEGIVQRYTRAGVPPPEVLYVDKECCGDSCVRQLFGAWPDLCIRLDIWHFMRRFTAACTTDAHQLYGVFMSRLSKCIFRWSSEDLKALSDAKRSELQQRHLLNPSEQDVLRWLTKNELALHCRRQTRGTEETTLLIGELLEAFMGDQGLDTLGVPLFDNEKMTSIWETQKKHVKCIQDPDGVSLYTKVGTSKKGTIMVPKFRCARGSVSLESFHNHLAKFIPGTTASYSHYQAYLLDGLRRWNEDRLRQQADNSTTFSYSGLMQYAINDLSQTVLKEKLVKDFLPPRKYTGEKIGIEYLFAQTGKVLQDLISDTDTDNEDLAYQEEADTNESGDEDPDEGFEEIFVEDDPTVPPVETEELEPKQSDLPSLKRLYEPLAANQSVVVDPAYNEQENNETVDPDNISGYEKVNQLASFLFSLRNQTAPLNNEQADEIMCLWNNLSDFDKQPTVPLPRHKERLTKGSTTTFKMRTKNNCVPGVDSVKRAFHGSEGGVAQRPDSNRYMELLIIKLCEQFPSPVKKGGRKIDRWNQVSRAYRHIRELVAMNPKVHSITLYSINNATLSQWYCKRVKVQDKQMLQHNIRLPEPPMSGPTVLPPAQAQVPITERPPIPQDQQHVFSLPPYTVGTSGRVRKQCFPNLPSESPANPDSDIQRFPVSFPVHTAVPSQFQMVVQQPVIFQPVLSQGNVARSTDWYRKQQQKKKAAGEYVRSYSQRRPNHKYTCHQCMKVRDKDTHTQFKGKWYCKETATESLEVFMARERSKKKTCKKNSEQDKGTNEDK